MQGFPHDIVPSEVGGNAIQLYTELLIYLANTISLMFTRKQIEGFEGPPVSDICFSLFSNVRVLSFIRPSIPR